MRVEVRPIKEKSKWHGKTGKESFARPHTIEALADAKNMQYNTGLSEDDIKELVAAGCKYDLSLGFVDGVPHPFWESKTASVKLINSTIFFEPDKNMLDFIKVKLCKASKYVANSQEEYDRGDFPFATHVIFDEAEQVKIKASATALKKKAIIECSKLSRERKIQLIMILAGKDVKQKSDDHIEVALDELIEESTEQIVEMINMDKEETEVHALVLECLMKTVLVKRGHKIQYNGSTLGGDIMEVVHYLCEDEHNELRMRLVAQLNM